MEYTVTVTTMQRVPMRSDGYTRHQWLAIAVGGEASAKPTHSETPLGGLRCLRTVLGVETLGRSSA